MVVVSLGHNGQCVSVPSDVQYPGGRTDIRGRWVGEAAKGVDHIHPETRDKHVDDEDDKDDADDGRVQAIVPFVVIFIVQVKAFCYDEKDSSGHLCIGEEEQVGYSLHVGRIRKS